MRANKYLPIWRVLKSQGTVKLSIPVGLQDRIIKAVIRTKDEDIVYKFEMGEAKRWSKLSYTCEGARVTFFLTTHIQVKQLALEDL